MPAAPVVGPLFAGFGGLFGVLGLILLIAFWPVGLAFFAFGLLFGGIGYAVRTAGRKDALRQLQALQAGVPAQGQLVSVSQNTSESVNGRHPWQLDYVFQVNGQMIGGSAKGYDPINGLRRPGQQVWVVHLPNDPSVSSLWPPSS